MIPLYPAYKELLKANEIFARQLVIRTHKEVKSITKTAEILKTTRKTVRKILKRFEERGDEKNFTNGLIFMMSLIYFLRYFGIKHEITLQTDNGEELEGNRWISLSI